MKVKKFFGWFWVHKKISAFLIIILLGIGGWFYYQSQNKEELEQASIGRGEVTEELILSGQVVADEHVQLFFPASGTLSWITAKEGDDVYKGQALAKLDTIALNSAYQQSLANLRAAEANLAQVYDEVKGNDADETFEQKNTRVAAETAKDRAYEAVVAAQDTLRKSTLYAPFAGIVTSVANPYQGVNVIATQSQIEIINPDTIHFVVFADQTEVLQIKEGEKVRIILDAMSDKEIEGEVTYVSYSLAPTEVSAVYEVKVKFLNLDNDMLYRVGMTGDVYFTLEKKEDVFYVPSGFLKSDETGDYVLINNGKNKVYVEVGLEGEERTEVSGDLQEGTLVYD